MCKRSKLETVFLKISGTVLEVGTGFVVIAVVWLASLVFGMLLLRASGSSK